MATYYIATTGNDTTGDGSSGNPWATISKAHTSATDGDTIIVNDGTYTWTNQSITKNLTIQAANVGQATFDGGGASVDWEFGSGAISNLTITITGLTFTDSDRSGAVAQFNTYVTSSGNTITFDKCTFHNMTANTQQDNGGVFSTQNTPNTMNLTNCLVYDVQLDVNDSARAGIFSGRKPTRTLQNITIYLSATGTNQFDCIMGNQAGDPTYTLTNCIIQNDGDSLGEGLFSSTGTVTKTITYTNTYGGGLSLETGTGNISSDSLFVDAANGNFNLRPTSPCIDAGVII